MPCGCGSNCSCGSGCQCRLLPLAYPAETIRSTAVASAREGCRCGSSCRCNPCNC
ncbi:unnamed protein product [Spirodela intermedia]|uniref:Metallothionein-like protein n=1 Tax=Spirodela intermedia TaxID=51605 RepID=A0A7I8K023_SPIIN|nr:unnamed protein product [Spirodela intermedia]